MTALDLRGWMWAEACAAVDRAEQLRRQFFRPNLVPGEASGWEPPIDVFDDSGDLLIVVALPGVDPGDLSVLADHGIITIRGVRRLPPIARGAIRRLEIPHGRFERKMRLPHPGFAVKTTALANGCLYLALEAIPQGARNHAE
jgi:HSP20 family protein